jgi:2-iminobutanoate/2-iminopropanoate deaminase
LGSEPGSKGAPHPKLSGEEEERGGAIDDHFEGILAASTRGHGDETLPPRFHLASSRPRGDTMSRDSVTTDAAPKSALYSQAVKAAGLVFVSGQAAFDTATGQLVGTNIQEQTRQCLENVSAILSAAGSSLEKVVSATFILRDPEDLAGMNEEWQSWFPYRPTSSTGREAAS